MNFKYIPKPLASLIHLLLILLAFLLFSARKNESLRFEFLQGSFPDFHLHISNFSLAFILVAGIGYFWLLMGISFKYVGCFSLLILLTNIVYESWIPILNTPDCIDAWYGVAGVGLATIEIYAVKRWGLKAS